MDNENLNLPVSGDVSFDRILEESPVFTCSGTVLYLDDENRSNGDLYAGAEVAFENPVPVKDDSGKLIGFADLTVVGKVVEAQCFLDYHTPERLSIETSSEKLYPSLVAQETLIQMDDGQWHIIYVLIKGLSITREQHPNNRITHL